MINYFHTVFWARSPLTTHHERKNHFIIHFIFTNNSWMFFFVHIYFNRSRKTTRHCILIRCQHLIRCALLFDLYLIYKRWVKREDHQTAMTGLTCWNVIAAFREMCALLVLDDCIFHMDFCSPRDLLEFSRMCSVSVCVWLADTRDFPSIALLTLWALENL